MSSQPCPSGRTHIQNVQRVLHELNEFFFLIKKKRVWVNKGEERRLESRGGSDYDQITLYKRNCEIVSPNNTRSYAHEVSPTQLLKRVLNKEDTS